MPADLPADFPRGPWPVQGDETPDDAKNRIVNQFKVYTSSTTTPRDGAVFSQAEHADHACDYLCQGSHGITFKLVSLFLYIL